MDYTKDSADSDEEFSILHKSLAPPAEFNEFDHYMSLPRLERRCRPLEYWKQISLQMPKLVKIQYAAHERSQMPFYTLKVVFWTLITWSINFSLRLKMHH